MFYPSFDERTPSMLGAVYFAQTYMAGVPVTAAQQTAATPTGLPGTVTTLTVSPNTAGFVA